MSKKIINSILAGKSYEQIISEYGKEFFDYVIAENGDTNFNNVFFYIDSIIKYIPLKGDVLDFGCGFGLHSILFRMQSPFIRDIFGVDIDLKKIEVFSKLIKKLNLNSVYPQTILSSKTLPFEDERFDVVYVNEVLSHVSDINFVLGEMRRVLKDKGVIIIGDTKKWNWWSLIFVYVLGHHNENYFSVRQMRRLLSNAGFVKIRSVTEITAPRNILRKWSKGLWWLNRFIDPKYVLVGTKSSRLKNENFQKELADWERNASFYAQEIACPFHQILSQEKMKVYKPIKQNCHILDLGAGVGYTSNLLQREGHRVTAIDFSLAMAKIAKQKYPDITYIVASSDELPLKNAKFDIVIADGIFHHLKAQGIFSKSLEEINRVLEKDGYLCFFDRHEALLSIILHWITIKAKRLIEIFKGKFSSSSTSQEVAFTEKDLRLIETNHFCMLERKFITIIPFFILMVITNAISYLFGEKYSFYLKKRLIKVAKFLEYRPKTKWMTVEQICKLKKI